MFLNIQWQNVIKDLCAQIFVEISSNTLIQNVDLVYAHNMAYILETTDFILPVYYNIIVL